MKVCLTAAAVLLMVAGCAQQNRKEAEVFHARGLKFRKKAMENKDPQMFLIAAENFAESIRQDDSYGPAHLDLGVEYLRSSLGMEEQLDKAIQQFDEALACDPALWEASQYKVNVLTLQGKWDEAMAIQEDLTESLPGNHQVHNNLGDLYLQREQWAEAASCYRKALSIQPDYFKSLCGMGIALWRSGELTGGIRHLERAVAAAPEFLLLRVELARAFLFAQHYPEAEKQVKAALSLDPENGLVYHIYAELMMAQGFHEQAVAMGEKAMGLGCALSPELKRQLADIDTNGK